MLILESHGTFPTSNDSSSLSSVDDSQLTILPKQNDHSRMENLYSTILQQAKKAASTHIDSESSKGTQAWWRFSFPHQLFSKPVNAEQLEANLFEEETRIRRYTAGQDREYFLQLVEEARKAINMEPPRLLYAQQLAGHVSSNIGFFKTILPHILALLILLAYFWGLALTIPNSEFFDLSTDVKENPLHLLMLAAYMGLAGGAVSMMFDFNKIFRKSQPPFLALIQMALRPLVGGFLAAFMFSVLASGFLNDVVPPMFLVPFNPEQPAEKLFLGVLGLSFLFGFSERIPSMVIQRTIQRTKPTPDSQQ